MANTSPISNTKIVTLIGLESAFATAATVAFQIAYDQNPPARNQTLEKNTELRGNRQMGTRVPGQKNPGGTLLGHQTDQLLPLTWYGTLGAISSTAVPVQGLSLTTAAGSGSGGTYPDAGAHTYALVVSKGGSGLTKRATYHIAAASTIPADASQKTNGTLTGGPLPVGWTWALYRTKVGGDPLLPASYFEVVPAIALAAGVTSYADDQTAPSLTPGVPTAAALG